MAKVKMPEDADGLTALWDQAGEATAAYVQAAGSLSVDPTDLADVITKNSDAALESQYALDAASDIVKWMKGTGKKGTAADHTAIIRKRLQKMHEDGMFSQEETPTASRLTPEKRARLNPVEFGDPQRRLFPVIDQSDVDHYVPLVDRAANPEAVKRNLRKICEFKNLTCPDEWAEESETPDMADFSVEFSLASSIREDGDHVIVPAPVVFRTGHYPDKNFSLSPEEVEFSVIPTFPSSGIELDLEHKPTVLSGKLGTLSSLSQDPNDPTLLTGECRIPKWLNNILGTEDRRLSVAFHRQTKQVTGCGLVRNPRVSDARMMAAFARNEAEEEVRRASEVLFEEECEEEEEEEEEEEVPVAKKKGKKGMKPAPVEEEEEEVEEEAPDEEQDEEELPEFARKKLREARRQAMVEFNARIAAEAVNFADNEINQNRAMPRERDGLIAAYSLAARDDARDPSRVVFGSEQVSRIEHLKRTHRNREPHTLTTEQLRTSEGQQTLFNRGQTSSGSRQDDGPLPESRRKELLELTQLGRKSI